MEQTNGIIWSNGSRSTDAWKWNMCSSINWAQLSRFYLKTEAESSLQNVVFWKINRKMCLDKDRMVDNVQKHNICTNVPSSQTNLIYITSMDLVYIPILENFNDLRSSWLRLLAISLSSWNARLMILFPKASYWTFHIIVITLLRKLWDNKALLRDRIQFHRFYKAALNKQINDLESFFPEFNKPIRSTPHHGFSGKLFQTPFS
jgi:hypothetical protein